MYIYIHVYIYIYILIWKHRVICYFKGLKSSSHAEKYCYVCVIILDVSSYTSSTASSARVSQ